MYFATFDTEHSRQVTPVALTYLLETMFLYLAMFSGILWRAFSNLCVYGERFHRLRVDGRPERIKKFAFTTFAFTIVFVWTGP